MIYLHVHVHVHISHFLLEIKVRTRNTLVSSLNRYRIDRKINNAAKDQNLRSTASAYIHLTFVSVFKVILVLSVDRNHVDILCYRNVRESK